MNDEMLSRRQFGTTIAALTTVGLAGCSDDETADDDGDDDPFDLDDPGSLTVYFENEDGEAVSNGIELRIEHDEEDYGSTHGGDISEGELADVNLLYEGEYTLTAESADGEFDTVEESVTLEEAEDEAVTLVLDGATPDSELEDEEDGADENGENGEDEEGDEEGEGDENGENEDGTEDGDGDEDDE